MKKILTFLITITVFYYPYQFSYADEPNEIYKKQFYIINDIKVNGSKNIRPEILISLSGLAKGDILKLDDPKINEAINKIWEKKIVNDIKIEAEIISEDKINLIIIIEEGKILADFNFDGITEKEEESIIENSNLIRGIVISKAFLDILKSNINTTLEKNGYLFSNIEIIQELNGNIANGVTLNIKVVKTKAQKVRKIYFKGNKEFEANELIHKMVFTKEINRRGILSRTLRGFYKNIFRKYKSPEKRLVRKSFFLDEFYTVYSNLFGTSYKKETLEKDLERIKKEIYFKQGYIDANIKITEINKHDEETVDIFIEIYEGPRYIINDIKWSGSKLYTEKELNRVLEIGKGSIFDKETLDKNLFYDPQNSIRGGLYHNNGYIFANISLQFTKVQGNKIDLLINIHEGEQATVDKINISGLKITKDRTIRKYLYTLPGNKYRNEDVIRSRDALARQGFIKADKFKFFPMPNQEKKTVDLEYVFEEEFNVGLNCRVGTSAYGLEGEVGGHFNNLSLGRIFQLEPPLGGGQSVNLSMIMSKQHKKYLFQLFDPWVFIWGRYPINFRFSIFHIFQDESEQGYSTKNYDNLTSKKTFGAIFDKEVKGYEGFVKTNGISIAFGKTISWIDDVTIISGINLSNREFQEYRIFYEKEDRYTGLHKDISLNLGIVKDNTNSAFFPTKGHKIGMDVMLTPPYSLIKDIDPTNINSGVAEYYQWNFSVSQYVNLFNTIVLTGSFNFGLLGSYSSKYSVGPFHRYHLGGEGSPRGYNSILSQEGIALRGYSNSYYVPEDEFGNKGGIIYDKLTFEIRHHLKFIKFMPIYVLLFCEGGDTWAEYKDFKFSELLGYKSYGLGFRAIVPLIGAIGISVGFGVDKETKTIEPEFHITGGLS